MISFEKADNHSNSEEIVTKCILNEIEGLSEFFVCLFVFERGFLLYFELSWTSLCILIS